MNSYNENLHSTVVSTLQAQELEQTTMKASLDASMFTLYYAGGARINASEQLRTAQADYLHQQKLQEQAVTNNNISINLLAAANQEKKYVAQSVTNTSVAAANIQVASNAILKLAGNMGSIFSMVGAADFHSDIYGLAAEAHALMNQTAFDAERVSQLAMEASMLTAEVSAGAIADEAKATNTSIGTLYASISKNFEAATAEVAADNAQLASTSAAEKVAEGDVESQNVEYYASCHAYYLNNKELNLGLKVPSPSITRDSYTVVFDYYESAFSLSKVSAYEGKPTDDIAGYPVSNYYIMLVKDNQKSTFGLASAEALVTSRDGRYIKIPGKHDTTSKEIERKIFISELVDSDGEKMILGAEYVIFVMAELMTEYKKNINDYSDYLSAPSAPFTLTNKLTSPKPADIAVKERTLSFQLKEYRAYDVQYRCMFLPVSSSLVKGLLSEQGLRTLEREIERLEAIAEFFDPKIEELETEIASLESDYAAKAGQVQELIDKEHDAPPKDKPKLKEEIAKLQQQMEAILVKISVKTVELNKLENKKKEEISKIDPAIESFPGFFFNLEIAEQVSAANYKKATMKEVVDEKDKTKVLLTGTLTITETMTDNFGNALIEGYSYVPVVLSYADPVKQDPKQFTNSLSAYAETKPFVYTSK